MLAKTALNISIIVLLVLMVYDVIVGEPPKQGVGQQQQREAGARGGGEGEMKEQEQEALKDR